MLLYQVLTLHFHTVGGDRAPALWRSQSCMPRGQAFLKLTPLISGSVLSSCNCPLLILLQQAAPLCSQHLTAPPWGLCIIASAIIAVHLLGNLGKGVASSLIPFKSLLIFYLLSQTFPNHLL